MTNFGLTDGALNPPAAAADIEKLIQEARFKLPDDYLDFLRHHDGGEGIFGKNYVVLWRAGELNSFNSDYEVEELAPEIILFGQDGGGEAYGFDTRLGSMAIVRVPLIGISADDAVHLAPNFIDFLTSNRDFAEEILRS